MSRGILEHAPSLNSFPARLGRRTPSATVCFSWAPLKPHSNGPLYSNTVTGTLAVDGWAVTFCMEGPGMAAAPPSPLPAVPNVTAHPSTASIPTSYYSM